MQIERLRLAGFKSFVEPTELVIAPGLTGIVGPNGCGKSNLVEALRWVMGEASARRLRGGEMDELIFGGSARRPARNLAEVALTIDNSVRDAPPAFGHGATIEIVRRMVRGSGSSYRINGREVRARDVQLLFADAASGPHSGALVGQGRIGELISARPGERRVLLDEAAGTAGLHARRHEAELKLRAAEDNLARLDDVTATLASQIERLKRQARQAERYRRLGERIRRTEAQLLHVRWRQAGDDAEKTAAELRAAERDLEAATQAAVERETARAAAEAALPPLRLRQAAAAAELLRLVHAREALDRELARAVAARADTARRREQVKADRLREAELLADADAALARLAEERAALEQAAISAASEREAASRQAEAAAADLAAAEAGLQQATEACAAGEARRTALDRRCRELAERRVRLAARLAESERQRESVLAAIVAPEAVSSAHAAVIEATAAAEASRTDAATAAETLAVCQKREALAAERAREAERALAPLEAEAKALGRLIVSGTAARAEDRPALSQLLVPPGLEAAVAVLFDGDLAAPLFPAEPQPAGTADSGWVTLPALAAAPLPKETQPLADAIEAPPALRRRLSAAALVDDPADGWRLQPQLGPGQSLVDRDGRLWRWDGFVRIAAGPAAAAEQLRQRNRLDRLAGEIAAAAEIARRAGGEAALARRERETEAAAERSAMAALRAAEERLSRTRQTEAELARRAATADARLAALAESVEKTAADLEDVARQAGDAERALAALPDAAGARAALERARERAVTARRAAAEAGAAVDRLVHAAEARAGRLAGIAAEAQSWRKRRDAAAAQQAILAERHAALAAELGELAGRPAAIAADSEALGHDAASAAAQQRDAEAAVGAAEAALRRITDEARDAAALAAASREGRARLQARREAADEALDRLRAEVAERLGVGPDGLGALAGGGVEASEGAAGLAAQLDRLLREREAMGAVNLLAAQETCEAEARLAGLDHQRADLTAAIAQLRRGIAALDGEGRKRLLTAFDELNGHFGALFARLFGGGKAELAWAGSGDPLEAGLEILASPPGKRLASLSLLSGGEQALTAIALIFAMFLTHPAPICVLDEVDAPLDDANVDSFCRLVADIADATGTRFLVITHHRVTMARMDRLFGVTMAERGVSQLVSVDLARAEKLRQSA